MADVQARQEHFWHHQYQFLVRLMGLFLYRCLDEYTSKQPSNLIKDLYHNVLMQEVEYKNSTCSYLYNSAHKTGKADIHVKHVQNWCITRQEQITNVVISISSWRMVWQILLAFALGKSVINQLTSTMVIKCMYL
jgi:hypothetical protein